MKLIFVITIVIAFASSTNSRTVYVSENSPSGKFIEALLDLYLTRYTIIN